MVGRGISYLTRADSFRLSGRYLLRATLLPAHDFTPQIIDHEENHGRPWYVCDMRNSWFYPRVSLSFIIRYLLRACVDIEIPLAYAFLHFFIVASSIATEGSGVTAPLSEFNNVFDPNGDSQNAFMKMVTNYPNFVAEEWYVYACMHACMHAIDGSDERKWMCI